MAYRFTNTDKWNDAWFSNLKPIEKLLFNYLCDNCDCAGFIEIITKNWANDIGVEKKQIEGALKGLRRGLIYSKSEDCIYLRTFLKHQKNLPLNENNQAHKGIIKRFKLYSEKFEISDISIFISRGLEGASKGLESPYGIGNGIGSDNGIGEEVVISEEDKLNKLREKALKFKVEVFSNTSFNNQMLTDFWKYWIEPNKSKTKLKYELEDTWDIKLRLDRWAKNNIKSKPLSHLNQSAKVDTDY